MYIIENSKLLKYIGGVDHQGKNFTKSIIQMLSFQNAWKSTYIRRIDIIDYNNKDARTEFRIVKGGCDYASVVFHIMSQLGKGINSTILFYGPTP